LLQSSTPAIVLVLMLIFHHLLGLLRLNGFHHCKLLLVLLDDLLLLTNRDFEGLGFLNQGSVLTFPLLIVLKLILALQKFFR